MKTPIPSAERATVADTTAPTGHTAVGDIDEDRFSTTIDVAVVMGSIRSDRFCPIPARWIADQADGHEGIDVDLIDLADYEIPADVGGDDPEAAQPADVLALGQRLDQAEAFVVVTPVYNRSYPASLKSAIDLFYQEWQLKPVGFVSYGGLCGGMEAVEPLRAVFTEFHSVPLPESVTFTNFWEAFDHAGRPTDAAATARRANRFLGQLQWWAETLRQARASRPYPLDDDT